jgi:CubicO group peptidase (beta-lactamase class C family)
MGRSNLSVDDMTADPDHAAAYERRLGVVRSVPLRPVTAPAPAGAINSCATDMARWLLAIEGQPSVTAEFELDGTGAVARLVAQPLGIFLPKT